MGKVIQAGHQMNRLPGGGSSLLAGERPALTVNRVCGSGAKAIVSSAQEILLGNANAAVAGGMETRIKALSRSARSLGLSPGRRIALRQRPSRRAQRRLLG